MEVRRKPGRYWTQKPGKTSSRDSEPWCLCEEKSETCYKHEQVLFWPWVKHVPFVAGAEAGLWWVEKQVGSEEVQSICTDFSFEKAGCEWKTYGGS